MRALIVAGGGMRSAYACGALLAFQEVGVGFDTAYGTSSGGAAAAWFVQGQADGFARTFEYAGDPRILSLRRAGLRRGPYLDLDYLVDEVYMNEGFDVGRLRRSPGTAVVTATSTVGGGYYLDLKRVEPTLALKATMGLPLLSGPPVAINGTRFVDGGVSDPLPVARAIRDGHREIVLVLNRPERRRRAEARAVAWFLGRVHPDLVRLAMVHHRLVMDSVQLAENPPEGVRVDILRPPEPTGIDRFTKDLDKLRQVIEKGEREGHGFLRDLEKSG